MGVVASMDALRETLILFTYGQKESLIECKNDCCQMFLEMK